MKLRIGRKNMRTLYVQVGVEPSDQDIPVGFAVDWHTAQALCTLVNEAEFDGAPPGASEHRWEHFAEMGRMANWIEPAGHPAGD